MALFKIFRGEEVQLETVPKHDGYAYFTSDKGNLYIDVGSEGEEDSKRVQVNALSAVKLSSDGTTIEIDDIVLKTTVEAGALAIGKSKEEGGLGGLTGVGALFADVAGQPKFGNLPLNRGGTGGQDAQTARENLEVYSKTDVDTAVNSVTTVSYQATLQALNWQPGDNEDFVQTIRVDGLRCGKAGNVPPIITFSSNREDYSKIDSAEATGQSIKFTSKEKLEGDIGIIIIDNA